MFGFGNSSSKKQHTESLTQGAEQSQKFGIGSKNNSALELGNVKGNATVTMTKQGLTGENVESILRTHDELYDTFAESQRDSTARAFDAVESISGSRSETGRTIQSLAMPITIVVAIALIVAAFILGD